MRYSIVVPVFNRPDEIRELLESLTCQSLSDFEVIIVEDGSKSTCKDVCDQFAGILDLHYYYKENSGPGQSRNYGAERASGEWIIVLDSDVVLPKNYLENVEAELYQSGSTLELGSLATKGTQELSTLHSPLSTLNSSLSTPAAWGGPDAAHPDFTPVQKAISYSMTSFFTTGGIRGGKKKLDKFFPRSFNMGVLSEVYKKLGGFSKMRFGEDIDFSYRIVEAGYQTRLLSSAWVWHKRRTDFRKFWRQVFNSGIARINLYKKYPESLKVVHLLPAVFTIGCILLVLVSAAGRLLMHFDDLHRWYWLCAAPWIPILLFCAIIFIDSSIRNKCLRVGVLSIPAAFIQLFGYGCGFLQAWWRRCVLGKDEFSAYNNTFYK